MIRYAASPVEILAWQRQIQHQEQLTHAMRTVADTLSRFINSKTASAWPSLRTLANAANASLSSVKRTLKVLVALELLEIESGNRSRSNRYRIRLPAKSAHQKAATEITETATAPETITTPAPAVITTPESQLELSLTVAETPRVTPATAPVAVPVAPPAVAMTEPEQSAQSEEPSVKEPSDAETTAVITVIEHLNRTAHTCFFSTPDTESYRLVYAALRTHSVDALCAVIDLKTSQWLGTERARYLRPITLFNPDKLENYLSEVHQQRTQPAREPASQSHSASSAPVSVIDAPRGAAYDLYVPPPPPKIIDPALRAGEFDYMYKLLGRAVPERDPVTFKRVRSGK